jgi:predicted dehydrogenase
MNTTDRKDTSTAPDGVRPRRTKKRGKVRYAVVGLGHIAQAAVLPAFQNAKRNSVLTALVSDDPTKLRELGERYGVQHTYTYDEYDACLTSGEIDAVYIALPNTMHCEYTVRAAEAGIHVLCEKPMATTEEECQKMIHAAESSGVRLMIAYRLHFEADRVGPVRGARRSARIPIALHLECEGRQHSARSGAGGRNFVGYRHLLRERGPLLVSG